MDVIILMATYNGEEYLKSQLDSLLDQSFENWHLYVRDDGSCDNTVRIIKDYIKKYPQKISLYESECESKGAKYNFWELCKFANREQFKYVMFCDQDDYWKSNKIEDAYHLMKTAELTYGNIPILIHTDLTVVDENLTVIGDSFIKYRALNPKCISIEKLLVQNNVTGCTMMVNNMLLSQAIKVGSAEKIALHDWWFSIVASLFGKIIFENEATILYRQHESNVVGATKVNTVSFILKRLTGHAHVKETFEIAEKQASVLLDTYEMDLDDKQRKMICDFAMFQVRGKLWRLLKIFQYRLFKQGIVQVIGELIFV